MKEEQLQKYAALVVKTGVNIQKNQTLVIMSPIECAEFTRLVTEAAYKEGAREVVIHWNDEISTKIKYLHGPDEIFDEVPNWQVESMASYSQAGACFLSISASDPDLMKEVDAKRISRAQKAKQLALREHTERLMSNKNSWCVVSVPTRAWASKIFPGLDAEEAVEKLWDKIFKIVRVDRYDPVAAWKEHTDILSSSMSLLNKYNFKKLHFTNSIGTDLVIELPKNHLWLGGAEKTSGGTEFIANIPTEEVFSAPKKDGVNGIVYSTKPLNYGGNLVNNFSLTFEDGKVVDFSAEEGYDTLKGIIETDEGSKYLGEVALVPYDSPISNSGIIFYNTLYDENASCHLALGRAYSSCIADGDEMSSEELMKAGINTSLAHVDFMIGSEDLNITGTTYGDEEIPVFRNGNWAFHL
ncbi:aminopeptidase [Alloiococcus sp. CFN-8]|uniref:aminopeptidase n=1 Tax=Alloiococcus sp. CFN-8 TaxID=3416081 RepID=UPI003CF5B7C8